MPSPRPDAVHIPGADQKQLASRNRRRGIVRIVEIIGRQHLELGPGLYD